MKWQRWIWRTVMCQALLKKQPFKTENLTLWLPAVTGAVLAPDPSLHSSPVEHCTALIWCWKAPSQRREPLSGTRQDEGSTHEAQHEAALTWAATFNDRINHCCAQGNFTLNLLRLGSESEDASTVRRTQQVSWASVPKAQESNPHICGPASARLQRFKSKHGVKSKQTFFLTERLRCDDPHQTEQREHVVSAAHATLAPRRKWENLMHQGDKCRLAAIYWIHTHTNTHGLKQHTHTSSVSCLTQRSRFPQLWATVESTRGKV